ncbi:MULTISPECIES: thioredoxin family protein [unclassified Dehalobacter]|jgi:hypothetical protein|uniref:thioredoxin family protein n=1 Tax=unclassified Dehalobacter TaxID=2635733 RepID=UPI00059C6B47|nr:MULTISPECIES: thioredoxin family protein [unclassified Dehalobacter]
MNIKILVSCCSNYGLQKTTEEVIKELGITATVEKVSDMKKIMEYGVMKAPGVVVNNKVKAMGRVPSKEEIKKYIQDEMNA